MQQKTCILTRFNAICRLFIIGKNKHLELLFLTTIRIFKYIYTGFEVITNIRLPKIKQLWHI